MKSKVEPRPTSISPDPEAQRRRNAAESDEEPADGSQFFPGSGFFER